MTLPSWARAARRAAVALLAAAGGTACGGLDDPAPDPGTVLVGIGSGFYAPDTVTVGVGTVVRWTNGDASQLHRVVAAGGFWQSSLLFPNWWFEVRFDSAGTFDYQCLADSTHTETGTVIVF